MEEADLSDFVATHSDVFNSVENDDKKENISKNLVTFFRIEKPAEEISTAQ
ncbi:MAG: hypothetical protein FADNKDHG_01108 [Holosporales bacterium]